MRLYIFLSVVLLSAGCAGDPNINGSNNPTINKPANVNSKPKSVPVSTFEVVKTYPHDPKAFTQGLVFRDGFLYEGTGEYGDSELRKVNLDTGKVVQQHELAEEYFGEGIAIMGDKIYQLTWLQRTVFVYNLADFRLLREIRYND